MTALLTGTGLRKSYGRIAVLHGIDLTVAREESHVIIGPNGAGKTTLFKVLTGEVTPDGGRIDFEGSDVTRLAAHQRVHRGFGRTFQVARVFGKLTVRDNLQVALEARQRRRNPLARTQPMASELSGLMDETGLQRHADALAGGLAYGDRKRLELAMVLALQPAVLFLDEPTAGMSAAERQATLEALRAVRQKRKLAMLLTEHDMNVVFGLADRISVLHQGALIASGTPNQIRGDQRVRDVYLGDGDEDGDGDGHA